MIFIETPVFTRQIQSLLEDDEYAGLQALLMSDPRYGELIRGTGGLRKVRWARKSRGRGKSGGVRVIYYFEVAGCEIYMVLAYAKSAKDDLTADEKKILKRIVQSW